MIVSCKTLPRELYLYLENLSKSCGREYKTAEVKLSELFPIFDFTRTLRCVLHLFSEFRNSTMAVQDLKDLMYALSSSRSLLINEVRLPPIVRKLPFKFKIYTPSRSMLINNENVVEQERNIIEIGIPINYTLSYDENAPTLLLLPQNFDYLDVRKAIEGLTSASTNVIIVTTEKLTSQEVLLLKRSSSKKAVKVIDNISYLPKYVSRASKCIQLPGKVYGISYLTHVCVYSDIPTEVHFSSHLAQYSTSSSQGEYLLLDRNSLMPLYSNVLCPDL